MTSNQTIPIKKNNELICSNVLGGQINSSSIVTVSAYCLMILIDLSGGGLGVACWPLVLKFAGSNPAEVIGFLRAKKILSTPSFGREVKPCIPFIRFAACKRSLNGVEVIISAKLPDTILTARISHVVTDVEATGGERGMSKCGGKQWQTTPKDLFRMQHTRAIPVA